MFICESFLSDAETDEPADKESGERTRANKNPDNGRLEQQLENAGPARGFDKSKDHDADAIQQARNRSSYSESILHGICRE